MSKPLEITLPSRKEFEAALADNQRLDPRERADLERVFESLIEYQVNPRPPLLVCSKWWLAVPANGIVWPSGTNNRLIPSGAEAYSACLAAKRTGMHMGRMGAH